MHLLVPFAVIACADCKRFDEGFVLVLCSKHLNEIENEESTDQ